MFESDGTEAVCQHLLRFCQWGISSHAINHPKHTHIHVLGMYLMKGWSAAFVPEQVCVRGCYGSPGLRSAVWRKVDGIAAGDSNDKCRSKASAPRRFKLWSLFLFVFFFITVCVLTL